MLFRVGLFRVGLFRVGFFVLFASLLGAAAAQSDPQRVPDLASMAEAFEPGQVQVDGQGYGYRLLRPLPQHRDRARPLLVYLHGAGERGDDNVRQLHWLPKLLVQPERRDEFACFVLAVQCPSNQQWVDVPWGEAKPRAVAAQPSAALRAVQQAMQTVLQDALVDPARVYLLGMSMGGYGVWDLLARDGEVFAAAAPVCGGGDPNTVRHIIGLPVAIWHGADDRVVPVVRSRLMAEQYALLGLPVNYHEVAGVGHDVWHQAFASGAAVDWLFAQDQRQQRRGAFRDVAIIPKPDKVQRRDGQFVLGAGNRCIAPEELRGLASYFLDALPVAASYRPALVTDVAAVAGDIVLRLDATMAASYELDVGAIATVTAKDAACMRVALAAWFQALSTMPQGGSPAGTFTRLRPPLRAHLHVARPVALWTRSPLAALLRECWLGSVDTICFDGGAEQATPRAWRELVVHAKRLGIAIEERLPDAGGNSESLVAMPEKLARATSGDAIAKVLAGIGDAQGMIVQLTSERPDTMLVQARQLLAATAEGAERGDRPVHVGSFLSRLAARWR